MKEKDSTFIFIVSFSLNILLVIVMVYIWLVTDVEEIQKFLLDNIFTILVSIICSIIASCIFIIVTLKSDEQKNENLIKEITQNVMNINIERDALAPSQYYPSSDTPLDTFNSYWNEKISNAKKYTYYGASIKYACKRLKKLNEEGRLSSHIEIDMILPDPTCNIIFHQKSTLYTTREKNRNPKTQRSEDEIIKEEKRKIIFCLYALKLLNRNVSVYLIKDIPPFSIEMVETTNRESDNKDALVLGFVQCDKDAKHYPEIIVYEDKSIYQKNYGFYINRVKDGVEPLDLKALSIDTLLEMGNKAGLENFERNHIEDYYKNKF